MSYGKMLKFNTQHVVIRRVRDRAPREEVVHFDLGSGHTICGIDTYSSPYVYDDTRKPVTCPKCLAGLRKNEEEVRRNRALWAEAGRRPPGTPHKVD